MTFTLHRGTRPIEWLAPGTPLSLGSDGPGCRHGPAGLRWLECGQRLARRRRNVALAVHAHADTAAGPFERAMQALWSTP